MRKYIFIAVIALAACTKSEDMERESSVARFTTPTSISTRVDSDGTRWESGDEIGIFQLVEGEYTDSNVRYRISDVESGSLSVEFFDPEQSEILYPKSGSAIFRAYYPYAVGSSANSITADLSDQTDLGAVDMMVASSEWSESQSGDVSLIFNHILAKVVFNVTAEQSVEALSALSASLSGVPSLATYSIDGKCVDGSQRSMEQITMNVVIGEDGKQATLTAILHPAKSSGELLLSLGTQLFGVEMPEITLLPNHIYEYKVTIGSSYAKLTSNAAISPWQPASGSTDVESELYQDGTAEYPYLIATASDLKQMNNYATTSHFALSGNIYLADGGAWSPLFSDSNPFIGVIDGRGYSISGVAAQGTQEQLQKALFGVIDGGEVHNLVIKGE